MAPGPSPKAPTANESAGIRLAVIGAGNWGRHLVRNFAELGALDAIVDANTATADALATNYACRVATLDQVLADANINAVAIAAPAAAHYALARQALLAGKHTFVEKPLALELEHAKDLCDIAERLDRRLMVGHLLQYHPVFLELKRLVREGKLGRLQYLYSNRLNLGTIRREEDIMWSFAPHDISMILSLVGTEPISVDAKGGNYLRKTIADVTTMTLGFPAGENAHIFVSWLHPYKEQKLVLVGSEAMAVFDDGQDWSRKLLIYPHRVEWKNQNPVSARAEATPVPVTEAEPLRQECQHFLDCVRTGATPRTDGREGVRVLTVLGAATRALDSAQSTAPSAIGPATAARKASAHPGVAIHESAYIDAGAVLGPGTRIWHFCHVLEHVRIGSNCSLGQNVMVGPNVTIGSNVKIQNNVSVYEGVTLEDGVFCGPSCVFTNVDNPRAEIPRKSEFRTTLVKRGATIGANATVVCGHTLGAYSFVAAGAVVTADVPDYALVAGVPARRIGWMSKAGGRLGDDLVCPIDNSRYRVTEAGTLVPADG